MENEKKGSDWLIVLLGLFLLGYTAYRTVELLSLTLPPDNWWVGLFALGALDLGVVAWGYYFMHHAQSESQERIAGWLIAFDLIGVGFALFGDVLYQLGKKDLGGAKSDFTTWAVIIQALIIFANVVAAVIVPIISPSARLTRKRRRIYHDIEEKTLKAIQGKAEILGQEAAEIQSNHWLDQERQQYAPKVRPASRPLELPTALPTNRPAQPTFSADGGNAHFDDEGQEELPNFLKRGRPNSQD